MKTVQEKIAVMQAYADGQPIETRQRVHMIWTPWSKVHGDPKFDWVSCDYRIIEDQELKAFNMMWTTSQLNALTPSNREWMRKIINAVKAGEIT